MNDNIPLEIERKYIIEYPDLQILTEQNLCKRISMEQIYIYNNKTRFKGRIRKSRTDKSVIYTKTYKKEITPVTRIEKEEIINEYEYNYLKQFIREGYNIIYKDRYTFFYKNQCFEVDIFPFWEKYAVMEIELEKEDQEIYFPPFVKIIKEVTEDKRFRNSSLARCIIDEKVI